MQIDQKYGILLVLIPLVVQVIKPFIPERFRSLIPLLAMALAFGFILIEWGLDIFNALIQWVLIGAGSVGMYETTKPLHPSNGNG